MLRSVLGAATVLALCVGVTSADEIRAVIIKVEGKNITFAPLKGKAEKGAEQTLPAADNIKVFKANFNKETKKLEAGDPLEGGLRNDALAKIGEEGVRALIITDADNKMITEIRVGQRRTKE
jgi:hypothetical protein